MVHILELQGLFANTIWKILIIKTMYGGGDYVFLTTVHLKLFCFSVSTFQNIQTL